MADTPFFLITSGIVAIVCLIVGVIRIRGDISERQVGTRIIINGFGFGIFILIWVLFYGGGDDVWQYSENHSRLRVLAAVANIYVFLYSMGHLCRILDSKESGDALSVLDFSILAAWTNEIQIANPDATNIYWVGAFYGFPLGFVLARLMVPILRKDTQWKADVRKAISVLFVSLLAMTCTFFIEYHRPELKWYLVYEVVDVRFLGFAGGVAFTIALFLSFNQLEQRRGG